MIKQGGVPLTVAQLTGCDQSHLVTTPCGHHMQPVAAAAFSCLQQEASQAGFELTIASSFRSFDRQRLIWNGKASGQRQIHDDAGQLLEIKNLSSQTLLSAILRFSAAPGSSRHHWGSDVDVFDRQALTPGTSVELTPVEVAPGGIFDPLHRWLDERMAADESYGFFRPYARDRGGVAVERWHLSYAPASLACSDQLTQEVLCACWDGREAELLLREELQEILPELMQRYVQLGEPWCPATYY